MLFQANIECVERHGTPLTYPEAAGGCGALEGAIEEPIEAMHEVVGGS